MNDSSSDNTRTDTLPGGSVRVSFGVPAEEPTYSTPPATRVVNGGHRFHEDGSAQAIGGVTRHTVNHDGDLGGSIMGTRERRNGHDTVLMTPGDPTTRVQLRFAVQEGLIREVAQGVYADATTADGKQRTAQTVQAEQQQAYQQQQLQQQQQQAADNAGIFDPDEDAEFAAEFASVPDHTFRSAMASMINTVATGGDFTRAAATLAREAGVGHERAAEMVGVAHEAQERIVSRALAKVGIGEDMKQAAYASFREEPGKLLNAMHYLMHGRDVSQFQDMGRAWLAKTQRHAASNGGSSGSPAAHPAAQAEALMRQAGFETRTTSNGVPMIRRGNGPWVTVNELSGG